MNPTQWVRRMLARVEVATTGYFEAVGWYATRATRRAGDANGNPTPWFTYPAIALFAERVKPEWRVLEFGCGMGTLWWAAHVAHVVAVEHDATWAGMIAERSSATILQAKSDTAESYLAPVKSLGRFDVVIVDGMHRNECLNAAADLVSPRGVVVLDDAQRAEYWPAVDALRANGFRVLPLHGPQPVSKHAGCTAILYRTDNVLGL